MSEKRTPGWGSIRIMILASSIIGGVVWQVTNSFTLGTMIFCAVVLITNTLLVACGSR